MLLKENIQRAGVGFLLDRVLKYVDKDPKKNILKLIGLAEKFAGKTFPEKTFKASAMRSATMIMFGMPMR